MDVFPGHGRSVAASRHEGRKKKIWGDAQEAQEESLQSNSKDLPAGRTLHNNKDLFQTKYLVSLQPNDVYIRIYDANPHNLG